MNDVSNNPNIKAGTPEAETQSGPLASPKKISMRQLMILFLFTAISGITRIVTPESGRFITSSSWVSPIFALVPILPLIYVLYKITQNHKEKSLAEIIELVCGKVVGKIILFAFLIHTLFLTAVFLRNFGEKFISTIFPNVTPIFFTIVLLLFAIVAVRRNIEAFARFGEIAFILVTAGFALAFFLAMFHADASNLLPVTYYDILPIINSARPLVSLWSLITFSLFLGGVTKFSTSHENSNGNDSSKTDTMMRTMTKYMLIIALFSFLSSIMTIGVLNADTASNMSMPYFMIFRSIRVPGIIQGFETFFIIFWAFTDFLMIGFHLFIISKIFKTLFVVEKPKLYMFSIGFILLILAWFIGENNFEVDYFYTNIVSWSSIVLGFVFPFLLLGVGKIRRKL